MILIMGIFRRYPFTDEVPQSDAKNAIFGLNSRIFSLKKFIFDLKIHFFLKMCALYDEKNGHQKPQFPYQMRP